MKKILWKKMRRETVSLLTVRRIRISDQTVELLETTVHLNDGVAVSDIGNDAADNDGNNT